MGIIGSARAALKMHNLKQRYLVLLPRLKRLSLPFISDNDKYQIVREAYFLFREITDFVVYETYLSESQEDELIKIGVECKQASKRYPRFLQKLEQEYSKVA